MEAYERGTMEKNKGMEKGMQDGVKDALIFMLRKDEAVVETPLKVRLIALCNSAYKVFTGMITVRLKNVMQKYVKVDQKGFIADRHILENVLEFKIWRENIKCEQSLVSLDFAKAYDKVDVGYMIHVLERMDFPVGLVLMIKSLWVSPYDKEFIPKLFF